MRFHSTLDSPIRIIPPGFYVLTGVVNVRVDRGQLHIKAGVFEDRPEIMVSKAASRLTRLVVLGHSGSLTFQALRWLHDIKAALIQIDYDASVIVASVQPGLDYPKLRRAQALARDTPQGLQLVRDLIARKIAAQASLYPRLDPTGAPTADRIDPFVIRVQRALSIDEIRTLESQAASLYWNRWSNVPVHFARKGRGRIPEHWSTFGARTSPLSGSPRKAGGPANAILNYLYALLEAETRIAALTMGLDPGLGILHADQPNRDSLVYDLMEPVRPEVDAWLFRLFGERRFSRNDFFETPEGQIMLTKPLSHQLVQTLPLWAKAIAPIVEETARHLLRRPGPHPYTPPTKLTQTPTDPVHRHGLMVERNTPMVHGTIIADRRSGPPHSLAPNVGNRPQPRTGFAPQHASNATDGKSPYPI